MTDKNDQLSKIELLEKLEKRIDEVETSMKSLVRQSKILMSEVSSPFTITNYNND